MAYNSKNYLERIVEVQELVKMHQKKGSSLIWIYKNIINPIYRVSYSTYNNYLATPAKRKLKEIENEKKTNRAPKTRNR